MTNDPWLPFWGKAMPGDEQKVPWHRLVFHCLDVAACGRVLLERDERLCASICSAAEQPPEVMLPWVTWLLAIHDLGKFSVPFQRQVPHLAEQLLGWTQDVGCEFRHDQLGYHFFTCTAKAVLDEGGLFTIDTGGRSGFDRILPWLSAVTGHHGKPPRESQVLIRGSFPPGASAAALGFLEAARQLTSPPALVWPDRKRGMAAVNRASWLIAGLAIVADWLGSSKQFFPYSIETLSLDAYWKRAIEQATKAVEESGVLHPPAAQVTPLRSLFSYISQPTPLQALAEVIEIPDEPQMFFIEDVTGAGKTEAALMLAHRMMAAGRASGVYFALPTMATANGMFERVRHVYHLFFKSEASLVLAHGQKSLHDLLRLGRQGRDLTDREGSDAESATSLATDWLSDGNKKALLAPFGVGTVDQAMLAALPVKHGALRLVGLHRHVLIIDEVHAYDVYMVKVLHALLAFHASLGGSAILLSATLPLSLRRELAEKYQRALNRSHLPDSDAYPMLSQTLSTGVRELAVDAAPGSHRRVPVTFIESVEEVLHHVGEAVKAKRCVVWIRNTVSDAIDAFDMLKKMFDDVTLFHARFAMGDRMRIEQDVLDRFGKNASPEGRRGAVVITTQVVEQSLDLDFDEMITDLCPVDLLIQRAGRLRRHVRDGTGTRLDCGADGRGAVMMRVLAPRFSQDPGDKWLTDSPLRRASFVYRDPALLWRTMLVLREFGAIEMPGAARALVERVYDVDGQIPEGLEERTLRHEGEESSKASLAKQISLHPELGYTRKDKEQWVDEAKVSSRLGDETRRIRLALLGQGRLVPLVEVAGLPPWTSWALSELSVRATMVDSEDEQEAELVGQAKLAMPDECRYSLLLVLRPVGETSEKVYEGRARDKEGRPIRLRYRADVGLERIKQTE